MRFMQYSGVVLCGVLYCLAKRCKDVLQYITLYCFSCYNVMCCDVEYCTVQLCEAWRRKSLLKYLN